MSEAKEINVTEDLSLGDIAVGSIDPQTRVDSGEITIERVVEVADSLSSYYELAVSERAIPKWCVDGRLDAEGLPLAPNAAGGTYSLVIGEALIDAEALLAAGETSATHGKRMFAGLAENGYEVGGHTDNHANEAKCGCGACDKQAEIISFVGNNVEELSKIAASLGVEISTETQQKIAENSHRLVSNGYVASGNEMINTLKEIGGDSAVQTLKDAHNEVALGINTKPGTTLNRRSLDSQYGSQYEAFNLDVWALKNGIDAISSSEEEAAQKFAAAVLYNVATAAVLAGPSLRVRVV